MFRAVLDDFDSRQAEERHAQRDDGARSSRWHEREGADAPVVVLVVVEPSSAVVVMVDVKVGIVVSGRARVVTRRVDDVGSWVAAAGCTSGGTEC